MANKDMGFFKNAGLVNAGKIVKTATDAVSRVVPQTPLAASDYQKAGIRMPAMPNAPQMPAMPDIKAKVGEAMTKARTAANNATQRVRGAMPNRMPRTPRTTRVSRGDGTFYQG